MNVALIILTPLHFSNSSFSRSPLQGYKLSYSQNNLFPQIPFPSSQASYFTRVGISIHIHIFTLNQNRGGEREEKQSQLKGRWSLSVYQESGKEKWLERREAVRCYLKSLNLNSNLALKPQIAPIPLPLKLIYHLLSPYHCTFSHSSPFN